MKLPITQTWSKLLLSKLAIGFLISTAHLHAVTSAPILINEVDPNDTDEFIELKGDPGASLNGYTLVFFGSGLATSAADNKSYRAIPLDGYNLRPSGYFVVGTRGVPNVDLVIMQTAPVHGVILNDIDGILKGEFSAVALYQGAVPYPLGPPAAGVLASATNLVDAVTYSPARAADKALIALLTPPVLSAAGKLLAQPSVNENIEGMYLSESIGRFPNAAGGLRQTGSYRVLKPTAGASNGLLLTDAGVLPLKFGPSLTKNVRIYVTLSASSVVEGAKIKATVTLRTPSNVLVTIPSGGITISVRSRDTTEMTVPGSITLPAGKQSATSTASNSFDITGVQDGWKDGNQVAFLELTAPGCFDAQLPITVTDKATDADKALVITEVHSRVAGDANGDGSTNDSDQFIEIVNRSDSLVDLSGMQLKVDGVTRYTFPAGAKLNSKCCAVVFAGGVNEGIGRNGPAHKFGGALVLNANLASGFQIDPSYGIVQLMNGLVEEADFVYNPWGLDSVLTYGPGSAVRGGNPLAAGVPAHPENHALLSGNRFSPGSKADGTQWNPTGNVLQFAFTNGVTIAEAGENAQTGLVVSRTGPTIGPVDLRLTDLLPTQAKLESATVTIPAGALSAPAIPIDPVRNSVSPADGLATFDAIDTLGGFDVGCYKNNTLLWQSGVLTVKDEHSLTTTLSANSIVESAVGSGGDGVSTLHLSRPSSAAAVNFEIRIRQTTSLTAQAGSEPASYILKPDQITLFGATVTATADPAIYTVSMGAGVSSVDVQINPVNDAIPEALMWLELAVITVPTSGSLNGVVNLQLVDNGGLLAGPVINEVEADPPGIDDLEYVELATNASQSLNPYVVALINNSGAVYASYALTGLVANSDGYFVLGDPRVLNGTAPSSGTGFFFPGSFDLLDGPAAVALYKNPDPSSVMDLSNIQNNLLDVVVYGNASPLLVAKLAKGQTPVAIPAADSPKVISRSINGGAFRDLTLYSTSGIMTPALSNTASDSPRKAYWATFSATGGDGGDPDLDGIDNVMEYAFGLNPVVPFVAPLTPPTLPEISPDGKTITIYVGTVAGCDPALTYVAEVSTDLLSWSTLQSFPSGSLSSSVSATYSGPAPVVYLRARVQTAP